MSGSVYTMSIIGEFATKTSQVFVPAKDCKEFFAFADAAESHNGEYQYSYKFESMVNRKPRGMALWNEWTYP